MKTKTIITLVAGLLLSGGFAFAQTADTGPCGQERGSSGNECTGEGYMNQGNGNGHGGGARRGARDGSGKGAGEQQRQRKRDGSGEDCGKDV